MTMMIFRDADKILDRDLRFDKWTWSWDLGAPFEIPLSFSSRRSGSAESGQPVSLAEKQPLKCLWVLTVRTVNCTIFVLSLPQSP